MNPASALTQVSLVAAFVAGMVSLFAPCCISYLLPSYLANIFKEKSRILLMTLVYSLGIFLVMMPVVLGAKALSNFFLDYHDQTYYLGGVLLILVGIVSFLGIKLPMPHFSRTESGKTDIVSTFILGIFSGITSACCAPVLIGVLTLSSLSPSLAISFAVGAFYVAGMVTPLYLTSLFIHRRNLLAKPIFKRKVFVVTILTKTFPIFVSNIVAAILFIGTGLLLLVLTVSGKLAMTASQDQIRMGINNVATLVTDISNRLPAINLVFIVVIIACAIFLFGQIKKEKRASCCDSTKD